ncbi:hypothetical protein S40285_01345 [Stachybotrys chlorohalonatus IBT 40285]|uniref:PHD-type domain-containing protein n=1 Tax=Stachybotrys chlorohalonatus (strain IBT 40285) TaxID=1283841 RepID=A0A084QLA8_STAC4|nr:hypothetical protein S40285_01345 [Stachybotrys chlorohalonata IBT 40285]
MDPSQEPGPSFDDQPQFELINEKIKTESITNSPIPDAANPLYSASSKSPIPSTETPDFPAMAAPAPPKKKGTASAVKRGPKRMNGASKNKKSKTEDSQPGALEASDEEDVDESDNGPYCICRGPDDHRWMICCEKCEDWFHGECIHISKDIGESLIEKFICPNCSNDSLRTIYKKTCGLTGCRKAARHGSEKSVFCSDDHAQIWWERLVSKLPKPRAKAGLNDQLSQPEFMALLNGGLSGFDEYGKWRLARKPFTKDESGSAEAYRLGDEEDSLLENMAKTRTQLAEETAYCHKMLKLIELAQERRRAAIYALRFGEDICGYDQRLDTVGARDAFAAFARSPEGEKIFQTAQLGDPLGEGDLARGMCERKRCKTHSGWQKILALGIKHQVKEMASQAEEVEEEERLLRQAAGERNKRKLAETNWVEVLE